MQKNMGGNVSRKVNADQINKEIKSSPVVMYSKKSCGYCTMAKDLLNNERIKFTEHDLDAVKDSVSAEADLVKYDNYVNGLVYVTRQTSVPQIFICGEFIGGYTQLNNLKEENKLFKKIEVCANEYVI